MEQKSIIDEEIRKKLEVEMAVALIKTLYDRKMISTETFRAIEKDAKTIDERIGI